MTTVDHALHTALPAGIVLAYAGASPEILVAGMVLFGVLNSVPDLAGPIVALTNPRHAYVSEMSIGPFILPQRWDVYIKLHSMEPPFVQPLNYLWWPHLAVDRLFHEPDGKWWPRDWKKAAAFWLVEALFTAWFIIIIIGR